MKRFLLIAVFSAVAITADASTPPPTAVITHFPDRHEVVFFSGEEVLFDGSASHANFPGGSINRWDWYIDGSWQHGGSQNQHKTFSETFTLGQGETEKTFQVRLRVRDSQNQYGNKYLTVTVKLKPKRYYYLKDHLGFVRAVVDENGNVVSYDDYYPFGLQMPGRSLAGDAYARERYTGHEKDEETGWYHAGARYYDPVLGRWMNPDPSMDEYPGWSPYNHVLNNPLRFVDPNGLAVCPEDDDDCSEADLAHAETLYWQFRNDQLTEDELNELLGSSALLANLVGQIAYEVAYLEALNTDAAAAIEGMIQNGELTIADVAALSQMRTDVVSQTKAEYMLLSMSAGIGLMTTYFFGSPRLPAPKAFSYTRHSHFWSRLVDRGINPGWADDAVRNPLVRKPVRYDPQGRPSQVLVGERATVVVNPVTGKRITAWPTSSRLARKLKGQ